MSERRRSAQINFRTEPAVAEVIRKAFGPGELTEVATRLLYEAAQARLAALPPADQLALEDASVA